MTNASPQFEHKPSAHCETGVIANLLRHNGLDISEPMIFGLASALTFAYIKYVKINGMPLIAYRLPPKLIIKLLSWRIPGLKFRFETFKNEDQGMASLDRQLSNQQVVGLQTSVFFLPYFPEAMRFHFNAHNLLVYSKQGDEYQISDPVFSHLVSASTEDLRKARFAKGVLAPKGTMYYPLNIPSQIHYDIVIPKAIRFTAKLNGPWNPVPFAGVNGMRKLARQIRGFSRLDDRYARLLMAHIVRMQEEIGTGGAGFRFIYAAFLQEAANILNSCTLKDYSTEMTAIGDDWRLFAVSCARLSKKRSGADFIETASQLDKIADRELDLYRRLSRFKLN